MTDHILQSDLSTLDARRGSARIELSDDGSSYKCVRVFGAPPERVFRAFTDPADLCIWFPSGAPGGSELTVCESDPVDGGRYHYEMVIPEYASIAWRGTYTSVDRPDRLDADEWFVMGEGEPTGPPDRADPDIRANWRRVHRHDDAGQHARVRGSRDVHGAVGCRPHVLPEHDGRTRVDLTIFGAVIR